MLKTGKKIYVGFGWIWDFRLRKLKYCFCSHFLSFEYFLLKFFVKIISSSETFISEVFLLTFEFLIPPGSFSKKNKIWKFPKSENFERNPRKPQRIPSTEQGCSTFRQTGTWGHPRVFCYVLDVFVSLWECNNWFRNVLSQIKIEYFFELCVENPWDLLVSYR
mgnify:CR=1 FL=1